MGTTYTVTNDFVTDTTAVADQVDANFTDILTAINALDAGNLASGTVALARISSLTSTQMAAAFFKDEDAMTSDSATAVASQQSVKAYADAAPAAQMTPTTYAGGESVTLANGLVIKGGITASVSAGGTLETTFGAAFGTALLSVVVTPVSSSHNYALSISASSTSAFTIKNNAQTNATAYWIALGY